MITYTVEKLFHFLCGYCGKWFSIGDWQGDEVLACPHCRKVSSVVEEAQE